jgi:hypothetical protein
MNGHTMYMMSHGRHALHHRRVGWPCSYHGPPVVGPAVVGFQTRWSPFPKLCVLCRRVDTVCRDFGRAEEGSYSGSPEATEVETTDVQPTLGQREDDNTFVPFSHALYIAHSSW